MINGNTHQNVAQLHQRQKESQDAMTDKELAMQRERHRLRERERYAAMTEEQRALRNERRRARYKRRKENMNNVQLCTDKQAMQEEKAVKKERRQLREREHKEKMTEEQRALQRERKHAQYKRRKQNSSGATTTNVSAYDINFEVEKEKAIKRERHRVRERERYAAMTEEQRALRNEQRRARYKRRKENKSSEQMHDNGPRDMKKDQPSHMPSTFISSNGGVPIPDFSTSGISFDPTPNIAANDINYIIDILHNHVQLEVSRLMGHLQTPEFHIPPGRLEVHFGTQRSSNVVSEEIPIDDYIDIYEPEHIEDNQINQIHEDQIPNGKDVRTKCRRQLRRSILQRSFQNCARNYVDSPNYMRFILPPPTTCKHCEAKLFPYESPLLCCQGDMFWSCLFLYCIISHLRERYLLD